MPSDLTPRERRALSARAHHLDAVVTIGQRGVTESVVREIDRALDAHELIKVRADADDRAARAEMFEEVCRQTGARPVKTLGKIAILWRARPLDA
jgi:RNA-binding protein